MPNNPKEIHGNSAKVNSKKEIVPQYLTNSVTISEKKKNETPIVDDTNVSYARKFSQENQK